MKNLVLLISTLFISSNVLAQVTIEIPDTIQVLAVNAEKPQVEGGLFSSTKTLNLADGENQVVFRYSPYFSQGNDRVIVDSEAVITKFDAANQTFTFELPEYKNANQAEKVIGEWQVKLLNQQRQPLALKQDILRKDGLQIGRDYVLESEAYNRTTGIAALSTGIVATQALPAADVKVDANTAEEMLHFWYQKADAETRAKFKQYVNQQ